MKGGFCPQHIWSLNEIADSPILLVARVTALETQDNHRFVRDPKFTAPEQNMTAEVEVLRFFQSTTVVGPAPPRKLQIRFLGRDGPDFYPCLRELPSLAPGQVLLLPLHTHVKGSSEPWQLAGVDGYGMITRVAAKMKELALPTHDARLFIIRELVNSLSRGDPIARFTAASLMVRDVGYLKPDLSNDLEASVGKDAGRWAQILGNLLLQCPSPGLTVSDLRSGKTDLDGTHFSALAQELVRLALSRLPDTATAETLVWQSLLADVPGFADEPYHPLFAYNSSFALSAAVHYLSRYGEEPAFIERVKTSLRENLPGSSALASALTGSAEKACLSEALSRALKVIARPAADESDLFSAIMLVLNKGSDEQIEQYEMLANQMKSANPDYAAFLQLKLHQTWSH